MRPADRGDVFALPDAMRAKCDTERTGGAQSAKLKPPGNARAVGLWWWHD